MKNARSDYAIVVAVSCLDDPDCRAALTALEANIRKNAEGAIILKSDHLTEHDSPSPYEILIGKTNRPESVWAAEYLREKDYLIRFTEGKLTVIGGSDEATAQAIRHFNALFFKKKQSDFILRKDFTLHVKEKYPLDTLSIFGYDQYGIGILYDASTEQDARALQSGVRRLTGYTLPLYTKEADRPAFTLAVTSEDRALSANREALTLSHGDSAVRSERINALLAKLECEKEIHDTDFTPTTTGEELSLLSLNVYRSGYGENAIVNRYPRLMAQLSQNGYPDLLTLQDVSPAWTEQFDKTCEGYPAMSAYYHVIGIGRNGDDESAKNLILYRKDKFTLIDSGTFWLSDTWSIPSFSAEGSERANATYALLEVSGSGERFAVINTALDASGEFTAAKGIAKILRYADTLTCPVILAGDFQSGRLDEPFLLTTAYRFQDSMAIAEKGDGYRGATTNGAFGEDTKFYYQTDFIFTSYGDFAVYHHTVDRRQQNGGYVSNHHALLIELAIKSYREE